MLAEILKLNYLVTECNEELKKMKIFVVGSQQYEYAAQLRDFEKKLEAVKYGIASLPYPIVPTKGLTINGTIYSSQLFIYGQAIGWNNLPDYIYKLFCKRKEGLNVIIEHSDVTTEFLISLNVRLKNEENRINDFINSLMEIYQLNQLDTVVDDFSYGGIVAQFLTSRDFSRLPRKEGVAKWSMYEFEVPIENWITKRKAYYENPNIEINNIFLNTLPLSLRGGV